MQHIPLLSMLFLKPVLLVTLCLSLVACQSVDVGDIPASKDRVTIGIQTSPAMALVMVAKDKGFFEEQGVDVELKEFTAGKFALEAFLAGSLDYSISGDVPVALSALQGHRFIVPAQVVRKTTNEVRVVARRDAHSTSAQEYFTAKKRKLSTSIGGGPEFFTYEFLKDIGVGSETVEIISQKPGDMPAALSSGSVDAIAIFDPFAYIAENQLGEQSVTFTNADIYSQLYVLEAHESVREDSKQIDNILRALLSAEQFVQQFPDASKEIVMKYTNLDRMTVDGMWSSFDFRIGLTPALPASLQRVEHWAKETGKAQAHTPALDVDSIIWPDALQRILPDSVEL